MNNYITITDSFNSDIIDNDIIVPNKTYFNIYNNSISHPGNYQEIRKTIINSKIKIYRI